MGRERQQISVTLRRDHFTVEGDDQLSRSGATTTIPIASACHRVHPLQASASGAGDCTQAAAAAHAAAIAELRPAIAMNSTASSPRSKRRGEPIKRCTKAAPTSASIVLPAAINPPASAED